MKLFWDLIRENLGADFAEDRHLQELVRELSLAFTEERSRLPKDYLNDEELQAAYLAYFVPLNFEKVRTILSSHKGVWPAELDLARPQRWVDFGAGPGTAMLAAMAAYKARYKKIEKLPPIHVDLIDTQLRALDLAHVLIESFARKLGLEVKISLHDTLKKGEPRYDLALAANVLNELPPESGAGARELLMRLWDATTGVMLVLEPGHRVSSQRLVRFRERLLKEEPATTRVLGPCPHQGHCPVHRTKHWCHFSEPVADGNLIDLNLRIFKNPRGWLKFSYLLCRRAEPLEREKLTFRAIGDLHPSGPKHLAIDLCQPDEKFVLRVPKNLPPELRSTLVRGAIVTLQDEHHVARAIPMTKRELRQDLSKPSRKPKK